jgi:hypothetical protein
MNIGSKRKKSMSENNSPRISRNDLIAGGALILIGILFLLNNFFNFQIGDLLWPFFVIVPGVLIFAFSLTFKGETGLGFAIPGGIITMVGLILLYQNTFDHYESWAYAWALVAPTAIGLAQIFYGSLKGLPDHVETGRRMVVVGVGIFAAGAFFFEVVLGISGFFFGLREYAWPILLIGLGTYLLVRKRAEPNPLSAAAESEPALEPEEAESPNELA